MKFIYILNLASTLALPVANKTTADISEVERRRKHNGSNHQNGNSNIGNGNTRNSNGSDPKGNGLDNNGSSNGSIPSLFGGTSAIAILSVLLL
jgi:hypothetical protein